MKLSEAIKASTMYGVVKGDPKGKGEVVFKGSNKKAEQIVTDKYQNPIEKKSFMIFGISSMGHQCDISDMKYCSKWAIFTILPEILCETVNIHQKSPDLLDAYFRSMNLNCKK